jgi:hypothetical protein
VRRRQVSITPLPPTCRGQCEQSHVMTEVRADMAADGIIGTSLKRCIHRHLKLPDQRPLRQPKLLLTKSAISLAAEVGHGRRWSH